MKRSAVTVVVFFLVVALTIVVLALPDTPNPLLSDDSNIVVASGGLQTASENSGGLLRTTLALDKGDSFTVTVYAHHSAGMRWAADIKDIRILTAEAREYIPDQEWPMIGGPGHEVWTFMALAEGEATITLA